MKTLVFDVYSWKLARESTLESLGKQIDQILGGKSTGCFLVKLGTHAEVQQEPAKPYWIPMLQNNVDRVERALGFKPKPTTEEEARNIYLAWMRATDYKEVLTVWQGKEIPA